MKSKLITFICSLFILQSMTSYGQTVDNTLIGKVFSGYQGWFNCKGDESPRDTWAHWGGNPPSPGNLTFEVYPDISDYAASSLFQSGFSALGDGQAAKLFSSYRENVIDTHCQWLHEYGIDGVALQRFLGPVLTSNSIKANRDSIAVRLRRASEKYETLYYLMYDMTPDDIEGFKGDVEHMENDVEFMDSPNYAMQNGKPVICLWGIGFDHRDGDGYSANSQAIIDWLHTKGYYVIGGVPSRWRNTDGSGDVAVGYENVFASLDMLSPWTPGRYKHVSGADDWKRDFLDPDKVKCDELGIDYQPVIFPGFAWSNWNGGAANAYPRHKGEFLWAQVENIVDLGIPSIYVAMFDEYDEGTNIMKMADSYLGIPGDQYFLTSSADGSYISSDFYLRLVGKASRVLKGLDPVTDNVTIPFSEGPIYFRTSVEPGYDAVPNWIDSPDALGVVNISSAKSTHIMQNPHIGQYSLKFEGSDISATESSAAMKIFDVDIPVYNDMKLHFQSYASNEISRYATIDLVMNDGHTLSGSGAEDTEGQLMLPSAGRGVINEWTKTICRIGEWLDTTSISRDTIDKIIIHYDHAPGMGEIVAHFDDVSIYRLDTDEIEIENASILLPSISTEMDPGETISVSLTAINTGTSPWTAHRGYKLGSRNPQNNTTWGLSRVELGGDSIPGGSQKTFTFDITAPDSLGKYNFQWQIVREIQGEEDIWVGEVSENIVITVGNIDGTVLTEIYDGLITKRAEIHEGEGAEKAFDNLYTDGEKNVDWTKWLDNGGIPSVNDPCWIQIEFPDSVAANLLTIVSGNDYPARDPEDFSLLASNDNETWTVLKSWTGQSWSGRFEEKLLPLENSNKYRFYRLDITKNKGENEMTQLCEIRLIQVGVFLTLPGKASEPSPENNALAVGISPQLSWTAGENSNFHEVYFGTTNPPEYIDKQNEITYDPGTLEENTTYYWRISEKNGDGTKVGDLWSFTTEIGFSDAAFVSQSIPNDTLQAGVPVSVEIVVKNTGESTWTSTNGDFSLGSQNPENNTTWGSPKIILGNGVSVNPGEEKTFSFYIYPPVTPGKYNFQWQMQNQDGWFGEQTENLEITIPGPVGIYDQTNGLQIEIINPANKGIIHISTDNMKEALIVSILSMDGKVVHQELNHETLKKINISSYTKGLYLVTVQNKLIFKKELILLQ